VSDIDAAAKTATVKWRDSSRDAAHLIAFDKMRPVPIAHWGLFYPSAKRAAEEEAMVSFVRE
jgi:hypothetical protein